MALHLTHYRILNLFIFHELAKGTTLFYSLAIHHDMVGPKLYNGKLLPFPVRLKDQAPFNLETPFERCSQTFSEAEYLLSQGQSKLGELVG